MQSRSTLFSPGRKTFTITLKKKKKTTSVSQRTVSPGPRKDLNTRVQSFVYLFIRTVLLVLKSSSALYLFPYCNPPRIIHLNTMLYLLCMDRERSQPHSKNLITLIYSFFIILTAVKCSFHPQAFKGRCPPFSFILTSGWNRH